MALVLALMAVLLLLLPKLVPQRGSPKPVLVLLRRTFALALLLQLRKLQRRGGTANSTMETNVITLVVSMVSEVLMNSTDDEMSSMTRKKIEKMRRTSRG